MANIYQKPLTLKEAAESTKVNIEITYNIKDDVTEYINALRELLIYEEHRRSYHLNIRFHVIDLLKQKGHYNFVYDTTTISNSHTTHPEIS